MDKWTLPLAALRSNLYLTLYQKSTWRADYAQQNVKQWWDIFVTIIVVCDPAKIKWIFVFYAEWCFYFRQGSPSPLQNKERGAGGLFNPDICGALWQLMLNLVRFISPAHLVMQQQQPQTTWKATQNHLGPLYFEKQYHPESRTWCSLIKYM